MGSTDTVPNALRRLGGTVTHGEADRLARLLDDGESLRGALRYIEPARAGSVGEAITLAGFRRGDEAKLSSALHVMAGSAINSTTVSPVWTMPDYLATSGQSTRSLPDFIRGAIASVTCATFNFQESSEMVSALKDTSLRGDVDVRVFMDTRAADYPRNSRYRPKTTIDVAKLLTGAKLHRTMRSGSGHFVTHAKFVVVDHRIVYVTSANWSRRAENDNIELGLVIDDSALAADLERTLESVVGIIYEPVEAKI